MWVTWPGLVPDFNKFLLPPAVDLRHVEHVPHQRRQQTSLHITASPGHIHLGKPPKKSTFYWTSFNWWISHKSVKNSCTTTIKVGRSQLKFCLTGLSPVNRGSAAPLSAWIKRKSIIEYLLSTCWLGRYRWVRLEYGIVTPAPPLLLELRSSRFKTAWNKAFSRQCLVRMDRPFISI